MLSPDQIRRYFEEKLHDRIKRVRGDEADALCPFHEDRNPSFSANLRTGAWICHAGDGAGGIYSFEQKLNGGTSGEAKRRVLQVVGVNTARVIKLHYDYPTYRLVKVERYSCEETCGCEHNHKRHRVSRSQFWQRQTSNRSYVNGLADVERVPYRRDDLLMRKGQDVWAVEGLEDVNTLGKMGFRVLSFKDPWPEAWIAKYLAEEKVSLYILPDKDEAGLKQAERFASRAIKSGAFREVLRVQLPAEWPSKFDATKAARILHWGPVDFEQLRNSTTPYGGPVQTGHKETAPKTQPAEREAGKGNVAGRLVALAIANAVEVFHDQFSDGWACVPVGDRQEVVRIRGRSFQRWLAALFWKTQSRAASSEAIRAALNVLEAKAIFEGRRHDLHVRWASYERAIWYDLGSSAVRITEDGWEVVGKPPILFRRYAGQQPQPLPERGGSITRVLDFVNLPGTELRGRRLLFVVQLVVSCIPNIPRPIFRITGTKGSAKTTLGRVVQRMLDPNEKDVLTFPDSVREFIQTLAHHYCGVFDNLGEVPRWGPDALCRAVTGSGFAKRELYTDDEDILYSFKRVVVINSIWGGTQASDLLDRCVLYELPDVRNHEDEEVFWARFDAEKPRLLGGLFEALSAAMRNKERLRNVPAKARMADFARWGMAVATGLGVEPADFLDALDENSRMVRDEAVHSSPVGVCLVKLLEQVGKKWICSPAELLKSVTEVAPGVGVDEKSLPRNPSWLSRRVKEIAKDLQVKGWIVEMEHSGERRITFRPSGQIRPRVRVVRGEPDSKKRIPVNPENCEGFSELDTKDTISLAQHSERVPETPPSNEGSVDPEGCDDPNGEVEVEL